MINSKPSSAVVYATILLVVSLFVGAASVLFVQMFIENSYKEKLNNNAVLRANQITSTTVNGQVMGSVATLGLINQATKAVAKGELPLDDPSVQEALSSIGTHFVNTTGVYMIMPEGVIGSNWYPPGGKPLTGSVVKFRPYFKMAMQGFKNVYVAIGTTTGVPALYFAAPLYSEASSSSPIIGATVVRINTTEIESVLNSWKDGPALLLSPQQITLLSNKPELNTLIAKEPSAKELKEIKELKQFGVNFDKGTPKILPFDIDQDVVTLDGTRYALARANIEWNDPMGQWTFLVLGDLDALMGFGYKLTVGLIGFCLAMMLAGLYWIIRNRLVQARLGRLTAINDLQATNLKLEAKASFKNYLNLLASDLHQATNHSDFAQRLIHQVVPRTESTYVAIYVLDENTQRLMPLQGFGVRSKDLPECALGEGLVGQCAQNKKTISLESSHDMPLKIVWGQGSTSPKSLILLPLQQMNEVLGVLVLASAKGFTPAHKEEINALLDTITIQLGILNRHLAKDLPANSPSLS